MNKIFKHPDSVAAAKYKTNKTGCKLRIKVIKFYTQIETYFTAHVLNYVWIIIIRLTALQIQPHTKICYTRNWIKIECVSFVTRTHNFHFSAWYKCVHIPYVYMHIKHAVSRDRTWMCSPFLKQVVSSSSSQSSGNRKISDEVCSQFVFRNLCAHFQFRRL